MKKHMKKLLTMLTGLIFALCLFSVTVFAGEWVQDKNKTESTNGGSNWWYKESDGTYPKSTWKWIGEDCYYFNSDGWMLASTITPDGFIVNANGAWIQGVAASAPVTDGKDFVNIDAALALGREIQKSNNFSLNPIHVNTKTASYGESSDAITLTKTGNEYTFNIYSKVDSNHPKNKVGLQALCLLLGNDGDTIYYSILTDYENSIFNSDSWTKIGNREYKTIEKDSCLTYIVR